ncbi:hypothetical protein [Chryseobacterium populi]|uniref:Uncharacterized protein n=1 Tax=Chryseobacterium populi TaxID=1144316 RepID=J3CCD6_9FLAO|nr:hypothetical protein [Chryseobacterium populi]EJL68616.1 hypothetical protein PMI13_03639 [Chryseobacterium populi]
MNRKVLLSFLYVYALIFSVLKTIRFPNDWSEAHWLLDYRSGFIKRGLAGEIFGFFFEKNELNILIVSALILVLLYISVLIIPIKQIFKEQISIYKVLFYLIFFLSQYIVFSAHVIGYLDHVVFLLAMLIIYLIKRKNILFSSIVLSAAILIHEISFFLILPASFFTLIITEILNDRFSFGNIFSPVILKKLFQFFTLPFVVMLSVLLYQEVNGENYYSLILHDLKHYTFINKNAAESVATAYSESFRYYLSNEGRYFFKRIFFSKCTVLFGIPLLFLLLMTYKEFKNLNLSLFILFVVVSLFPLLLHAIAWDTIRIWSFPFMTLFLAFWVVSSHYKTENYSWKLSVFEIILFMVSIMLVALVPNNLFNGEAERFSLWIRLIWLIPVILGLYFLKKAPTRID